MGLVFGSANPLSHHSTDAAAPAPAPAPAPASQPRDFKVAAVVNRTGDAASSQRSWSTFDDTSGGEVPMQTNPMASARESDLGRRAREIYAATAAPTRDTRTVSTAEQQQKAEL